MLIKIKYGLLVLAVLLLLPFAQVSANECSADDYADLSYVVMFEESVNSCFSYENNQTELGKAIRRILNDSQVDETDSALKALQEIASHIQNNYLAGGQQSPNAQTIHNAIDGLKKGIEANPKVPDKNLQNDWQWSSAEDLPRALENIDFASNLSEEKCGVVKDKRCETEFTRAADLARSIKLINAAIDLYTRQYRDEVLADRVLRRTKWDSYYDDLTFQYFWELWANNYMLERYDTRKVIDGNKVGFRPLPKSKLVLLHPEVNLAYNGAANDKFDETVTVEVLGYEAFGFDAMGKVKNPWGVSVLGAYLNSADDGDASWTLGLLFKYDGYSVGFTNNDGDVAVVLNFNLSQKVLTIEDKYRRYYDQYEEKYHKLADKLEEKKSGIYGIIESQ